MNTEDVNRLLSLHIAARDAWGQAVAEGSEAWNDAYAADAAFAKALLALEVTK